MKTLLILSCTCLLGLLLTPKDLTVNDIPTCSVFYPVEYRRDQWKLEEIQKTAVREFLNRTERDFKVANGSHFILIVRLSISQEESSRTRYKRIAEIDKFLKSTICVDYQIYYQIDQKREEDIAFLEIGNSKRRVLGAIICATWATLP